MRQDDFENHLVAVLIVGVLNMVSLGKMDGTGNCPAFGELLRIELSRVLTTPSLQSGCPEYRDVIDSGLAREILCQPWEALEPTISVIQTLAARVTERQAFPVKKFLQVLEYGAIHGDPCVYSIARRGRFIDDPDEIREIVEECCGHLTIPEDEERWDTVLEEVEGLYASLRQTLITT